MSYTQAPQLTQQEINSLLKEANLARLCTVNRDGSIHAVPVNYKYEAGMINIAAPAGSRKARNAKRNSNVTVLVDVGGGKLSDFRGVVVYGKASVNQSALPEFVSICATWMSPDRLEASSRGLFELTQWVIISIEPQRTASFDYAKDDKFAAATRGQ